MKFINKYLFVITVASILLVDNSFAQFKVLCISPDKLNTIKIDGNIDEWDWVGDNYKLKADIFFETSSTFPVDTNNFNVVLFVAWSEITNRIYIVAKVHDNIIMDKDLVQIAVNPSNSEVGDYWRKKHENFVMNYYFKMQNDTIIMDLDLGPEWVNNPDFFNWATKSNKENSTVIYEISFLLWEKWRAKGSYVSKECNLRPYKEIGLTVEFADKDSEHKAQVIWNHVYEREPWSNARSIANRFILDPYISKKPSWEGINHVLK